MSTVRDLLTAVNRLAPPHLAGENDPIGLQVGDLDSTVSCCMVSLDAGLTSVRKAIQLGANALVSHHSLLYEPVRSVVGNSPQVSALREAIKANVALITAHTNWDAAEGGVNDTLCKLLGLHHVTPFADYSPQTAYKIVTFVPEESLEEVIGALSDAGCGSIGLYKRCAFYSPGKGTYEPQSGSNPYVGEVGSRETASELRLEMLVPGHVLSQAELALRAAHPYDEPAYDLFPLRVPKARIGRIGKLAAFQSAQRFQEQIDESLMTNSRLFGNPSKLLTAVAVVGGAGGSLWHEAQSEGADALVTGEVRHHEAVAASESGFVLYDAGHYATEQPGAKALCERLAVELPDVRFVIFAPDGGEAGAPA